VAWFCDADKDEHGDKEASVTACEAPPGGDATCGGSYTASSDDCGPAEPLAHPGQTTYYPTAAKSPVYGPAFDYDCNGKEEPDPAQLFKGGASFACDFECFGINKPAGFGPNAVCGGKQEYFECTLENFQNCKPLPKDAPAPLRCR
jgi:hypothetical protein